MKVKAPNDSKLRAKITERVIEFNDDPKEFIKQYNKSQEELKYNIINARKIIKEVKISKAIYELASKIVNELEIFSQRADITFIRCARSHAAFHGRKIVAAEDLNAAISLVFEHRIQSLHYEMSAKEIEAKVATVFGKIEEAYENNEIYKASEETEGPLKHDDKKQDEFQRLSVNSDLLDVPETEEQKVPPPLNEEKQKRKATPAGGWKVKEIPHMEDDSLSFFEEELETLPLIYKMEKKMASILENIRKERKISNYGGRGIGRRNKIPSSQKGRYISYRTPINNQPKSIALDATIRNYLKNTTYNNSDIEFPLKFNMYDLKDKIYEYRAPLLLIFVLDSSASMSRVIKQMTDVILSLQKEGYRKKDKIALIIFRGKEALILQKPTVYFKNAVSKLKDLEGKSYTPMAAALRKCQELINTERLKNRNIIPVIFIASDCGANISVKHPDLIAQIETDYTLIVQELKEISMRLMKNKINLIILEPKKSYATQGLGVHTYSADQIKKNFKTYAKANVYKFDKYDSSSLILQLKKIL